ncbi:toxin-activating lysine-acyltransferase [Orbus sturtevantii]|uniref:toxin-activating lysine-acyltransferase n=1 Tax=Orbus sturtevantii TaxID=3074109 RepID=UPI00370DA3D3
MSQIQLISPLFLGDKYSEGDVFGSAVWLWMHSEFHKEIPLYMLPTLLLPAIKKQQFVLGTKAGKPIFFTSWAWMNEASEKKYLLAKNSLTLTDADWNSGSRIWFIDWVAPFGDSKHVSDMILSDMFANSCMRSLYHKGNKGGIRVKFYRGKQVAIETAKTWQRSNPLALDLNQENYNNE